MIQTCTLQGLSEVLVQQGVDAEPFLRDFGLTSQSLITRNELIPYWQYAEILRSAAELCRTPHLGLLLSAEESHRLYTRAVLGILLKYCATVGDAIEAITRYHHVVSSGADYRIERQGELALFLREGRIQGLKHDRVLQDMSLADFLWILRKALGEDWQPRQVMFTYDPPEDGQAYADYLGAPVAFSAARQGIAFDASALEHKVQLSGPQLEALIRDVVAQTRAQADYALADAVTQAIDLLLPTGLCCANSVATVFDVHVRTLRRRLAEAGLVFADLLDARRKKHAASYLLHTTMSAAEVGIAVGYAAPEAFNRAFRRWYGVPPSRWRDAAVS